MLPDEKEKKNSLDKVCCMLNASGEGEECSTTIKNTMGQILTATYPLISLTGQTQHITPQCQQVWWRTCAKYYNVSQFVNVFFCH